MNKSELISQISFETGISKKKAHRFLESFKSIIINALAQDEEVKIRNFGRFIVKEQKERRYYNFRSKQMEPVPAKKKATVVFAPFSNKYRIVIPSAEITHRYPNHRSIPHLPYKNSHSIVSYSTSGQNMIIPNMAVGERREMREVNETIKFEYWGKVDNGIRERDSLTNETYPFLLIPVTDTPILACTSFEGVINGVSEPILFRELQKLRRIEPDIKILKNVSLPIRNRNYGYKPDIAIVWRSKGVCIDVEIDEPYDILSRKPIHFTNENSSDYLRNAYFLENGWYVIRVAEEQVIKNLEDLYKSILYFVYAVSEDERFKTEMKFTPIKRWSRSDAIRMAEMNYREKYLGLPLRKNDPLAKIDDDYNIPNDFEFVRPDTDIIGNIYGDLPNNLKLTSNGHAYLKIKQAGNGYEYITTKEQINYFFHGVSFFDVVEEKEFYLSFADIDSYVGMDSIEVEKAEGQGWIYFVYEAIIHCRPLHFKYGRTSESGPTERTVFHLTPYVTYYPGTQKYLETHTRMEWLNSVVWGIYKDLCNINNMTQFTGYCAYRKDVRTFDSFKIMEGYAYDCYKPLTNYDTDDVLQVLEKGDGRLAEILYSHFTEAKKNKYFNIANNGHALVIQGKYDEALKYYFKYPEEMIISGDTTWRQILWEDIENFSRNETYGSNFDHMKKIIYDNDDWHRIK